MSDEQPSQPPRTAKEARAQARAERAYRKASRPWPLRHWILSSIGGLIVLIIIIVAATAGGGSGSDGNGGDQTTNAGATTSPTSSNETGGKVLQHVEDVTVSQCKADDLGNADARVKVTNHSSKASDYVITIAFESTNGSTQYGTGDAIVNSLQPGQTTTQDADSFSSVHHHAYKCVVSDAQRTESDF